MIANRLSVWVVACSLAVWSAACGGAKPPEGLSYADSAEWSYMAAMKQFDDNNCMEADTAFREVRRKYPYSKYAALSELRIADCLFKQEKYLEAIQAYREFVRHHPSHEEMPYARFRIAECFFEQIPSDWLLAPPAYERDQSDAERALEELRRFIVDFSAHQHTAKAQELAQKVLRLLAMHEMSVARFYLRYNEPKAATGRLETVVHGFRGSGLEPEALWLLGNTYLDDLDDPQAARLRFEQLVDEYPDSAEAKRARAALADWRN